ncbi:GNAT family N-acetyltransferase [Indioceanicola profundi]|uniref:GNAT family N-acetyltransferase n=1 Tax=Indioceanicola profundi TaxID=2220096 RepID=UPI000E6AA608|nr:GNAT family protein [Indioceanicola profundi]
MTTPPDLPRPPVDATLFAGRTVDLERADVGLHAPGLWRAIGADPNLWTHIPSGPFYDEAEFTAWLAARIGREGVAIFTVMDKTAPEGPVPAGIYFLLGIDPEMGTAEIGLVYGPALARRTGGTEAFYLLAGHVLGTLGYRRLEWRCTTRNAESMRAAERFGFTREGVIRQSAWRKGVNWDTAVYGLLDHEWPDMAARFESWLSPDNFTPDGRQLRPLSAA